MKQIENLRKISDARYMREQQLIFPILEREAQLRRDIKRIEEFSTTQHDQSAMRSIGADVVWLGWVARTRHRLNTELANVLQQKEFHMGKVRKSFGKLKVIEAIEKQQIKARQSKRDLP